MSEATRGEEAVLASDVAPRPEDDKVLASDVARRPDRSTEPWWTRYTTTLTEHAQDVVSAVVAASLILLAGSILVDSIVNFFSMSGSLTLRATDFLDRMLLVLILVEIVHTVVLSLRAHALAAQPFIVVGLVAVIRKILFALGSQQKLSATTLGIYVAMVAVFVAALVSIEVFGRRRPKASADDPTIGLH